jgi:hypothetical protein
MVECGAAELAFEMPVQVAFRPLTFEGVTGHVTAPLFVPV